MRQNCTVVVNAGNKSHRCNPPKRLGDEGSCTMPSVVETKTIFPDLQLHLMHVGFSKVCVVTSALVPRSPHTRAFPRPFLANHGQWLMVPHSATERSTADPSLLSLFRRTQCDIEAMVIRAKCGDDCCLSVKLADRMRGRVKLRRKYGTRAYNWGFDEI